MTAMVTFVTFMQQLINWYFHQCCRYIQ